MAFDEPPRPAGVSTYVTRREAACPVCHRVLNGATGVQLDATTCPPPSPGDLTVCGECGTLLAWTEAMAFRLATQEELDALEPVLRAMVAELNQR